jgi:excisionase family DNA binding protein
VADLLTSAQVAKLLGVTPMTVVRWTNAGRLRCEFTAGRHRRYRHADLEAFRRDAGLTTEAEGWVSLLRHPVAPSVVESKLLAEHARQGSWERVADALGEVLIEIGTLWCNGQLSVFEEHVASAQLARALNRLCEWFPRHSGAPRALLATPENEFHTLGLSLAELCLRAQAWETTWAGRSVPTAELVREVRKGGLRLLVLSASLAAVNARQLAKDVKSLERACEAAGTVLVLGGRGAWPKKCRTALRQDSFLELAGALPRLNERRAVTSKP